MSQRVRKLISRKSTVVVLSLMVGVLWPLQTLGFRQNLSFWKTQLWFAWGANSSGELGIGNFTNQPSPVLIHTKWKKIVGRDHVLALKEDGTLWAWGRGNFGQLGNNGSANKELPVQVSGGPWIDIGAGLNHSLAIDSTGRLFGWGANNLGQMGLGNGGPTAYATPQLIDTGPWQKVGVTSGDNSCAIKNGRLYTWGDNLQGGLGHGDSLNEKYFPTQVGSFTDWVDCVGGAYHMLGLRSGGILYAWGANNKGQVGNGGTGAVLSPVQISGTWTIIGAGFSFSLAVRNDGKLYTWGANESGQLGWGSPNGSANSTPTVVTGGASQWKKAYAGESQVYALGNDGTLWAWGLNTSGRLGDGTTTMRPNPVQISGFWLDLFGSFKGAFGLR